MRTEKCVTLVNLSSPRKTFREQKRIDTLDCIFRILQRLVEAVEPNTSEAVSLYHWKLQSIKHMSKNLFYCTHSFGFDF